MPSETTKLMLCVGIVAAAGLIAWRGLGQRRAKPSKFELMLGERPWRRLGAGIAVVMAVMFVAGVYVVDIPDKPLPYAIYWIIMLALVVWMCLLAVQDALHTRRTLRRWRAERNATPGGAERGSRP